MGHVQQHHHDIRRKEEDDVRQGELPDAPDAARVIVGEWMLLPDVPGDLPGEDHRGIAGNRRAPEDGEPRDIAVCELGIRIRHGAAFRRDHDEIQHGAEDRQQGDGDAQPLREPRVGDVPVPGIAVHCVGI